MIIAEDFSEVEKKRYITTNMKQLGKGSCRIVYETDKSNVVVKYVRKNRSFVGMAQNLSEFEIFHNASGYINFLCPIHDISDDHRTLVMDKALPIQKKDLPENIKSKVSIFKKKLKFINEKLTVVLNNRSNKPNSVVEIRKRILKLYSHILTKENKNLLRSRLFIQICEMILHHDVLIGDITAYSSWGYLRGRFVLIDFGCTNEIYRNYYTPSLVR